MKKLHIALITSIIMLSACSQETQDKQGNDVKSEEKTHSISETKNVSEKQVEELAYNPEDFNRELSSTEKLMLERVGSSSGENYGKSAVEDKLDKLPKDLTGKEYLDNLLSLLKEDYSEEVKTLVNLDVSSADNLNKPNNDIEDPKQQKIHYSILLDASGSMAGKIDNQSKMDIAKQTITNFVNKLPSSSTYSIRVYGQEGSNSASDKELSCSTTKAIYNGNNNSQELKNVINQVQPIGWTPIALALKDVKQDIPSNTNKSFVYVVSDGIETCGGDPVSAAKDLKNQGIETVVNIIGFDIDNSGQELLKEVAQAGGGEFRNTQSKEDINAYWHQQYELLQSKWYNWEENGKDQVSNEKEDKKQLLFNTENQLDEKINLEYEHLQSAKVYLEDKLGSQNKAVVKLEELIMNRRTKFNEYKQTTIDELKAQVISNSNEASSNYKEIGEEQQQNMIEEKRKYN
ncbi:VWA domain-containing protein [Priestia endophytica]|uniref:Ca-activated chloride channel family protein n=1 Tax=Priestia endophytica DSM 13796 TaxID=1121089 RepID=A0A1I6C7E5_9BACI|nr:VWA domain-containing protein [Priestia endophytica]KYG33498.1 hypothetical protein AZF06_21890 [Priestia endophytica]SFQ89054.1 Ca-activated chloride channel family protein [Priestia endophytica DSM 13796]